MNLTLYGPLSSDADAYVTRPLDDQVLQSINRGEYVNLRGGRQTGKTSLILRLRTYLERQGAASTYIDLSPMGEYYQDRTNWFRAFGEAVQTSLMPTEFRTSVPEPPRDVTEFQTYIYNIVKAIGNQKPLIIFVDEVTAVPDALQQPFFSTIRAMFNQRNDVGAAIEARTVTFVFVGSFDPERFIRGKNSPFNIAKDFDTSNYDFSLEQVKTLAAQLGIDAAAKEVYDWTDGHPYLTNQLLNSALHSATVDDAVQMLMRGDSNLKYLGGRLQEAGDTALQFVLKIKQGQAIPYTPGLTEHLDALMIIGLVKSDQTTGNAIIRCKIYTQYLERLEKILGNERAQLEKQPTVVDFLPEGSLRAHAMVLVELAPQIATKSPALAAICIGTVLETALLLELEGRSDLPAAIRTLNGEVNSGRLERSFHIRNDRQHPSDWTLAQLIEIARVCGLVSKTASQVSHGIRDWRNLVHPSKFRSDFPNGVTQDVADAAIANGFVLLRELGAHHTP